MSGAMQFHFTLGPVQGFVAQARRTRDFWAGSFLLSWLSATAMVAVRRAGGTIVFPEPAEDYLGWLEGRGRGEAPRQGSVPNRFLATVPEGFDAEQVIDAVRTAWRSLAEQVWRNDMKAVAAAGETTQKIWDRQVAGFWDLNWLVTPPGRPGAWVERRKNWRTHMPPPEPGVKCTVMDGWQELSGAERPQDGQVERFWQPLRQRFGLDVAEGEHLCAIAFIKRRFANHFSKLEAPMPGGWTLCGWAVESGVPSVAHLAAANWLAALPSRTTEDRLAALHDAVRSVEAGYPEKKSRLTRVRDAYGRLSHPARRLPEVEATLFYPHVLDELPAEQTNEVRAALKALNQSVPADRQDDAHQGVPPPSPYYAVLLMDGDNLGAHMSDPANHGVISRALAQFTGRVPRVVADNNGYLVYAGGDDVLALLPLEDALPCAAELRAVYLAAFEGSGIGSTLSGAVEFVHLKVPLTKVLGDAHQLLDQVAKEGCGRDALAVRVRRTGGVSLEWAQPWEVVLEKETPCVVRLAEEFAGADAEFSSRFFYKIRELIEFLNPSSAGAPRVFDSEVEENLFLAEYLASGVARDTQGGVPVVEARRRVGRLFSQCRPHRRETLANGQSHPAPVDTHVRADGALLVRFLAKKGVE